MNKAIDFARSSCTWLLDEPASYGRFALDAVIAIGEEGTDKFERFVLCAQVFACYMYAEKDLFKSSPYGYAAAFSESRYRIFRDAVRGQDTCEDTVGRVAEHFRELRIDVVRVACERIEAEALAQSAGARLSARVLFPCNGDQPRIALEFPIRHVNIDPVRGRFQVETGPVLLLEDATGEAAANLRRAYVAFGCMDRAEFVIDAPRARPAGRGWAHALAGACEITLLRIDECR